MLVFAAAFTACKKDGNIPEPEKPSEQTKEYKYLRVMVSDELSNKLSLINPFEGAVTAAITANGLKTTHFKSRNTESLIFNDNDGTLSVGDEAIFNTESFKGDETSAT